MNRHYSAKLLKNFQIEDFIKPKLKSLFESAGQFNKAWYENGQPNGWLKASHIIDNHEVFENQEKLLSLEGIFYNELFYNVPDTSYIFPIIYDKNIEQTMNAFHALNMEENQINFHNGNPDEFQLIHTKFDSNSIKLLFRNGYSNDAENKQIVFTISCIINLAENYMQINFKKENRTKSGQKLADVLKKVINYINNLDIITAYVFNPSLIKNKLFLMFKDESDRADLIIKEQAGLESFEQKLESAKEFLKDNFGIDELQSEFYEKYINRLMTIPYHQFALGMNDANFGERFMFAFSFYDGNTTRSTTRNSDKNHVYTGNLYWVLKDLIIEKERLSSISMFYKISNSNFPLIEGDNTLFLEVNIKECTTLGRDMGCINIEFLQTNNKRRDSERRLKNEFIIQEIREYFPLGN